MQQESNLTNDLRKIKNKPQLLIGVIVFYIAALLLGFLFGRSFITTPNQPQQEIIEQNIVMNTFQENQELFKYTYSELISTPSFSHIEDSSQKLELLASKDANLAITTSKLVLNSGYYYTETQSNIVIQLKTRQLKIPKKVKVLINADVSSVIVLSGKFKLNKNKQVSRNQKILVRKDTLKVVDFDRKELRHNDPWPTFLEAMEQKNLSPKVLEDLKPPKLTGLLPKSKTVEAEKITVYGTTDKGATVRINGTQVKVNSKGKFKLKVTLKIGTNKITFVASDEFGNKLTKSISITRKTPPPPPSQGGTSTGGSSVSGSSGSCSGSFASQLLCLINNHRNSNGRPSLSFNSSLNSAAQNHSNWMDANNTLNHTGSGGSSPWDRCANAGQTCDAENIAYSPDQSAQTVFNLWRNSSGHNTNMLGSHGIIGIGMSGGYATAVFY